MSSVRPKSSFVPSSDYQPTEVFLIVDGISTGKNIAPILRGNGYQVIHVLSKRAQGLGYSHKEFDYSASFKEGDHIDELLETLSKYQIRAVIPGAEAGVNLADRLNEKLGLKYSNDFSKTEARQDKFLMQETLHQEGIRAANQCLAKDLPMLLSWVEKNGLPIVLKPLHSSGTDGVHFCHTNDDVVQAFTKLIGNKTVYGQVNNAIVAQELLVGDEFMVNSVSSGKETLITEIILSRKKVVHNAPLYDYTMLISPSDERYQQISDYVKTVLNALGFYYGAAHTEVILTSKGPTLVEVNARVMGAYDMSAIHEATGTNQVAELVNMYVGSRVKEEKLHPAKYTIASFLMTDRAGTIHEDPDLSLFRSIPGCHSIKFLYKPGDKIPATFENPIVNLPGIVNFVTDSAEKLLECHQELRKREKIFFEKMLTNEKDLEEKSHSSVKTLFSSNNTRTQTEEPITELQNKK